MEVIRYNPLLKEAKTYPDVNTAAMEFPHRSIPRRAIIRALKQAHPSSLGFLWFYKEKFPADTVANLKARKPALPKRKWQEMCQCIERRDALRTSEFRNTDQICLNCPNTVKRSRDNGEGFLKALVDTCRRNALVRLNDGRESAAECSINFLDLKELYQKQNGKCVYSNIPLSLRRLTLWQLSVDRIDPNLGYSKSNIVLCALEFNVGRTWSQQKILTIPALIQGVVNLDELQQKCRECVSTIAKPTIIPKKTLERVINNEIHIQCLRCGTWKEKETNFNFKSQGARCFPCSSIISLEYANSFRGYLRGMLRRARNNMKARYRGRGRQVKSELTAEQQAEIDNTLSLNDLCDKLIHQGGRCHYSNIPLVFCCSSDWQASLERLDNQKGYTNDNTRVICLEFNSICHTKADSQESTQWNREKFLQFYNSRFANVDVSISDDTGNLPLVDVGNDVDMTSLSEDTE
jgi:hypothetical protein